jgi:hypothetical protein
MIDRFAHIRRKRTLASLGVNEREARDTRDTGQKTRCPEVSDENVNESKDFSASGHQDTLDTAKQVSSQKINARAFSVSPALRLTEGETYDIPVPDVHGTPKSEDAANETVNEKHAQQSILAAYSKIGVPGVLGVQGEKPLENKGVLAEEYGTPQKNDGVPGVPQDALIGEIAKKSQQLSDEALIERIARLDRERNERDRLERYPNR